MYNEDYFAVKIECGTTVGSGVLCQYCGMGFLITAAHCVSSLNEDTIKVLKQIDGKMSEVSFRFESYIVDLEYDVAIFKTEYNEKYPLLREDLKQEYIICGFPRIYEQKSSTYKRQRLNGIFMDIPQHGIVQLKIKEEIETGQSTALDTIGGLSGGCIYSNSAGEVYINGILKKLSSKEGAFGAVLGVLASKIIEIITQKFKLDIEKRIYTDITVEDIDLNIVPTIMCEDISYTYEYFADYVQNKRRIVQIIGAGGSGKTSFMKCLIKLLERKEKHIVYFELSILEKELEAEIENCADEAYVFLDGFNEVEYEKQEQIVEIVKNISLRKKNQTFIISSRKKITGELGYINAETFYVNPLAEEVIDNYVSKYQKEVQIPPKVKSLLTNPMMLTVYAKRCSEKLKNEEVIYFKFYNTYNGQAELISDYLESLIVKVYMDNNRNRKSLCIGLLVRYFLFPEIAFFMENHCLMYIGQAELMELLSIWIRNMEENSKYLKRWFLNRELEFSFEEHGITELKLVRYLKSEQSIFNYTGFKWRFVHQNYRDELAAEKIILDMSLEEKSIPDNFMRWISFDVVSYMSDLLRNDEGLMRNILDRMRYKEASEIGSALHNWLAIQKKINRNLAGINFSNLDLKNQELASHIDGQEGRIHTNFEGAHIYRENFFPVGHSSRVTQVCFMHSGECYATAADNGVVLVCNTRSGKVIRRLETEISGFSTELLFSLDDKFIFLAMSTDVVGWSLETGEVMFQYHSKYGIIRDVVLSPCDRCVAIAVDWNAVKVIHYLNKNEVLSVEVDDTGDCVKKVSYSNNGKHLLLAYTSGKVELWEITDKRIRFSRRYEEKSIRDVKYSNDGNKIAIAYENGKIYIVDAETGVIRAICDHHKKFCFMINFSPDDSQLVSASADETVIMWEVDTGKMLNILCNHDEFVQVAKYDSIGEVIVSSDCDGVINVWEAKNGKLRFSLLEHEDIVGTLAIHPYEKIFVSGSLDEKVIMWSYETGEKIQVLQNVEKRIGEYSLEKEYIFTIDEPSQVARVWNYNNVCLWEKKTAYNFIFGNGQSYYMWDMKSLSKYSWSDERVLWKVVFEDSIRKVIISPQKNYVCVLLSNLRFCLLDTLEGNILWNDITFKQNLLFSPYERYFLYSSENVMKLYDISLQKICAEYEFSYEYGYSFSFSRNERFLYIDKFRHGITVLDLFDVEEGTDIYYLERSFKTDDNMIVAATTEKNGLFLADDMPFHKVAELPEGNIRYIETNKNNTLLAIVYYNNEVMIFDVLEETIKTNFKLSDNAWRIAFSKNDTIVYIDDTKLVEYDFYNGKEDVILNQFYDTKLKGCNFVGAIFDENISAEEREMLLFKSTKL